MSIAQASKVAQLLDMTQGASEWLSDRDLLTTLRIALRTNSIEHADVSAKLYDRYRERRQDPDANVVLADLGPVAIELVKALASLERDREAMILCLDLSQSHEQPLLLWKALLTSYRDVGDLVGFVKVRDYMSMHSLSPDVHILNLELELLNRNKLFDDASELYTAMPSQYEVAPNWQSRLIMLETCMNLQKQSDAPQSALTKGKEVLARLRKLDLAEHADEVYPKILSWIVFNQASIDAIHEEIHEMKNRHEIELNVAHVNAMLYAANMSENWLIVERLWASFSSLGIYPTNDTFSLRIAASVMGSDTNGAKEIFEASKNAGYADMLDPLALQTLLAAEMMSKVSDDALCLYIIQLLEKIEPFPITATSLAFLIPKMMERKHYVKLEEILEKSRPRSDWDSEDVIETILDQLPKATDSKSVWNAFVLLRNLFWNDPIYTTEARFRLLRRLIELDEPKIVGQMFSQFLKSSIKPDDRMYISVLQGARDTRDYDLVRRIHQFMKMDMTISEHTPVLNTLMNAYAHVHSSLTFDVWEQIHRSGRGPTNASVSIVMDACTSGRVPNKGILIWRSLQRTGFPFNDNNYASYVEMLNKLASTEDAIAVLQREFERGGGRDIGARALSTLYNTSKVKSRVAAWAEEHCPDLWASLPRQ
ncbi:protein of unknown function [Taphrina deformans PYCC 5710]|uniref:Uncharacterized protein n=1 Tax=Taphrina deformans (strain PYCC 5710 / ATCC 11124 / CBS 356.35 / IMI 108563 / JCM 9778 / NBRC 8474) TaxID=1097556 RepID=R4XG83_TAPDE|nr:protein of unknown function [Taphrina deformans PYCC 5710]|eukprot:CCG84760.1 protein of unknown function [Taphrina deformans PYCC 5710]